MAKNSALLREGTFLNDRYRTLEQIGRGGFGRTYLAEDTQRYRELCVLKEFAPQVEDERELRKAEELFEREAGILYKLKHDRIPKFEALLKTRINGKDSLFLVQQYVEGESYWDLLTKKGKLTEKEVAKLIWELLGVLEYIHEQNLIHRDISPDNLIRRDIDEKPVLIDFGCVKIAANAVSKSVGNSVTLIGKKGYAPEEQMRNGQAFPCTDLYSLAATAIVLLTGKQPDDLYDSHTGTWRWEEHAQVRPSLRKMLNKMLAYHPRDRYQSATKVRQVLEAENNSLLGNLISRIRTLVVAPKDDTPDNSQVGIKSALSKANQQISRVKTQAINLSRNVTRIPQKSDLKKIRSWQWGLIAMGVVLLPGTIAFSLVQKTLINSEKERITLSQAEIDRQQEIYQKVRELKLDPGAFFGEVDLVFYNRYPERQNIQLSDKLEDQKYRQIWYEIAIDKLENQK
jgi:serine/threonine-protein kinase